jgi:hypothetical protein
VTFTRTVTGVLRAVVSTKANADEKGSRKVRLLAEPAREYGRLEYVRQGQIKLNRRHRKGA